MFSTPLLRSNPQITLTNMKSVSSPVLAEFTLMAILYFYKRVKIFQDHFANRQIYNTKTVESVLNKKLLLVGTGSIGQEIGLKCKYGLGMRISGVKRDISETEHLAHLVEEVHSMDSLPQIVSDFDVVVASLPHIPETIVFTEEVFRNMKPGSVFINVGRGSYVDEEALIRSLLDDHLLGAGLDVIDKEPIRPENHFYDERLRNKVLYTFHMMDNSKDLDEPTIRMVRENLENYINGKPLVRQINKDYMY